MSKTTGPLLSFGASGQIGKTLVYGTWKGRAYARRYVIPSNPNSAEQQVTRSLFAWLNAVYRFLPAEATEAWQLYGNNSRFTAQNGFIKQNLPPMRGDTDLANFSFSHSAGGGLAVASSAFTPGNDLVTVTATAPSLPTGWTVDRCIAACVRQQDPATGTLYAVTADMDDTDPYSIVLSGLASAETYVCGVWMKFDKGDGTFAYGQAVMGTALTT